MKLLVIALFLAIFISAIVHACHHDDSADSDLSARDLVDEFALRELAAATAGRRDMSAGDDLEQLERRSSMVKNGVKKALNWLKKKTGTRSSESEAAFTCPYCRKPKAPATQEALRSLFNHVKKKHGRKRLYPIECSSCGNSKIYGIEKALKHFESHKGTGASEAVPASSRSRTPSGVEVGEEIPSSPETELSSNILNRLRR